jgi:hypothetical protein
MGLSQTGESGVLRQFELLHALRRTKFTSWSRANPAKPDANVNSDQTQARILNFENDVHCDRDNKREADNVAPAAGLPIMRGSSTALATRRISGDAISSPPCAFQLSRIDDSE